MKYIILYILIRLCLSIIVCTLLYKSYISAEESIKSFMVSARLSDVGITPKLHMLEDHVIPFIEQWGYGLAYFGEQGFEKMHSM